MVISHERGPRTLRKSKGARPSHRCAAYAASGCSWDPVGRPLFEEFSGLSFLTGDTECRFWESESSSNVDTPNADRTNASTHPSRIAHSGGIFRCQTTVAISPRKFMDF